MIGLFPNISREGGVTFFHLYSKPRCFWRNLHRWQKFYTPAGSDGSDKFHLCDTWGCGAKGAGGIRPIFAIIFDKKSGTFWSKHFLVSLCGPFGRETPFSVLFCEFFRIIVTGTVALLRMHCEQETMI